MAEMTLSREELEQQLTFMRREVANLRSSMAKIILRTGMPDAPEACRLILKIAQNAMNGKEPE